MRSSLYKLLARALQYPDQSLLHLPEQLGVAISELATATAQPLEGFFNWVGSNSLIDLEQHYVETFDFNKKSGLYLSFFLYGDRRQRGVAMLNLKRHYRNHGLALNENQLPDYLPVILEFASLAPRQIGQELLESFRTPIELIRSGLRKDDSAYALLFDALVSTLPRLSKAELKQVIELAAAGPPEEQVGLEPFAPPETMPDTASSGTRAFCGVSNE